MPSRTGTPFEHLGLAGGDRLLDAREVEDDDPVLVGRHHVGERDALLGVVAGGEAVLALVVGVDVVEVAVDLDLPGDLHRVAVHGREDRPVLRRVVEDLAVVRERHAVLAVAEDIAGLGILLHPQAVDGVLVRELDDLVAAHDVEADAADAGVGLVVGVEVAAVVGAVGEGRVRVVQVAVHVDAALVGQVLAVSGVRPSVRTLRLSLVWPQPVARPGLMPAPPRRPAARSPAALRSTAKTSCQNSRRISAQLSRTGDCGGL